MQVKNWLKQIAPKSFLGDLAFSELADKLDMLKAKSDFLVLFGSPTEGNWLGIANATKRLFPENHLELPQWYSHTKLTKSEIVKLCNKIIELQFDQIIISGFADYFYDIIDLIYKNVRVKVIYHGTMSEWHDSKSQKMIGKLIDFSQVGKIQHVGFIKSGLTEIFNEFYAVSTQHLILPTPIPSSPIQKLELDKSKIHIGIFGADTFNKNLHQQVVLALSHPDSIVHVQDATMFNYLDKKERITGHGFNLDPVSFHKILGSMDINMHMSFSESWGQIVTESLALGVPCLTGFQSNIYDFDEELASSFYIKKPDDILFYTRIMEIIRCQKGIFNSRCQLYIQKLNIAAETSVKMFITI